MDKNIGTSGYGTLPLQAPDATICSNDSIYTNSLTNNPQKPHEGKVKAYVDFTEFNKNYEEYLKKKGVRKSCDQPEPDSATNNDVKVLERQNSSSSNQSEESWEVLS